MLFILGDSISHMYLLALNSHLNWHASIVKAQYDGCYLLIGLW